MEGLYMKKKLIALTLSALMITGLVGCGNSGEGSNTEDSKTDLKVGMVTDSGTIDDKSFNQGTWEGILKAHDELGIDNNYIKPAGTTEADYMKEIGNLYDTGYKFIVTPGYKFETAIFQAQDKYPDAKFVIIDGSPNNGKTGAENVAKVGENTIAIYFAEQEAGFLVGVAAALELKEGDLGFIGGMQIPAPQKFNWGFQQGIKYANENLGTNMTIKEENVIYEGTFDNVAGGQQLAATMFDRGVKAIFTAAGGVGVGAINEAKARAANGEEAWIIGVDVDQYDDGIYNEAENKSIILTSAVKKVDTASFDMIKDELDGNFKGGQTLTFDAKTGGVGIPEENPNLSKETQDKVAEVFEQIKEGKIVVSDQKDGLIEPEN
jgi:basic membrane protein A and related proteins